MIDDWPTRDLIAHRVETSPHAIALVEPGGATVSYAELDERVDRLAAQLAGAGVHPGDRVATLLSTRPRFATLVHAAMRLRVTLVPLNVEQDERTLAEQVETVDPSLLVCERETADFAAGIAGSTVLSCDPGTPHVHLENVARVAKLPSHEPIDREWTQLVLFTSGTTGQPSGVRLTTGNLLASATASAFRLGVDPADRWLDPLPMYHMGGLAPVLRSALYGTAVVLQRGFDAERAATAMAEHDVTGVSMVPTMLVRLLDDDWTPPDSLRFVLLGGAPASRDLIERCEDASVPVHPTYGMTETASQVATARPEEAFAHPGTVGRPLGNTAVEVLDRDGEVCQQGEVGELVVSGPTVTPGYLDEATADSRFDELGFHTQDVGYRDTGGRLWVEGRLDDVIVSGGENVHPERVRSALRAHPHVADAAVVGVPDEEWGERVAAMVVRVDDSGSTVDVDDLEAHCKSRLAAFERPRTFVFAAELPRTASGTVDRAAVRECISEQG